MNRIALLRRHPRCHRGMTLMELLLVLAILVLTAAISLPALRGTLRNQQLTRAGDIVRVEWARAHVQAMKTGRILMFRYQMGGQGFRVEPWAAGDEMLESAMPVDPAGMNPLAAPSGMGGGPTDPSQTLPANVQADENGNPISDRYRLPDEMTFVAGDAKSESRAMKIEQAIVESERSMEWSRPILFYPDGSTSDAFVVVGATDQRGVRIDLRGLTGTAKVSEIAPVEELMAETPAP